MSVNKVNKTTGELVTLANGTRMWIGTQSAHDSAVSAGTMPNNCMVCITDDYPQVSDFSVTEIGVSLRLHKLGNIVYVSIFGTLTQNVSPSYVFSQDFPEDFLPPDGRDVVFPLLCQNTEGLQGTFYLAHNQHIYIYPALGSTLNLNDEPRFEGCYMTA